MMHLKRLHARMSPDVLAAAVFLLLLVAYSFGARELSGALEEDVVGPDFFPQLISVAGAVIGIALLVSSVRQPPEPKKSDRREAWREGPFILLLFAYGLALEPVGFPLSTAVFLTAAFRFFGQPRWRGAVGLAVAVTAATFVLFVHGLGLKLPTGSIWAWLM